MAAEPVALPTDERSEAERVIAGLARDARPIPTGWLVETVMGATPGGPFDLHRAALEAVLRRLRYARRDELVVAERPARGQPHGTYRTRSKGRSKRPWETALYGVSPLRAECDCPDFRRGGLGICKHVLVVLVELAGRKRARKRAEKGPMERPPLRWSPLVPLEGDGDPLLRFELSASADRPAFAKGWRRRGEVLVPPPVRGARRRKLLAAMGRWVDEERAGPATRKVLQELAASAERRAKAAELRKRAWKHLKGLELSLYGYQREGVKRFLDRGRLLLADDMGLGKTIQATAACHLLYRSRAVRRGLVVVPSSLKAQWKREWQSISPVPVTLVEGGPEARRAIYDRTEKGFLLVGYAQLRRDAEALLAWAPEAMVLDEAQRMKNWETKTAQTIKRFAPPWRLVLTGTPLENRIEELASIMDWVDEWALAPKWRLPVAHVSEGGAMGLATLRERLAPHMVRRRRAEILDQLPERRDHQIRLELTPAQRDAHDDLNRPIVRLVHAARRRPLTPKEFLRLMSLLNQQRMVANGLAQVAFTELWPTLEGRPPSPALLRTLDSPKLLELRELVRSLVVDQGRRVVVFSQWRRMLRLAAWVTSDILAEAGKRAVFFTGQEDTRKRTRNVVDFHDEPDVALLFASDAGGVGLNLQRASSCCIQLEQPWNPAVFEQRVARVHRLGQPEPVDVITLSTEGSIEERIGYVAGAKRALFEGLFDGDADQVDFPEAAGFCERLERVLPAGALASAMSEPESDPDLEQVEPEEEDAPPLADAPPPAPSTAP
ncbi:MAG TPA: DEAD/DEAH box helicase, partial [Polyangiaceae bacterium LLY-WYZ-15_(1-7)]|nr:DEAD/DEAH box helicase [Polyangiaceae bacterium LLY-WYZ-15_(1-7)]